MSKPLNHLPELKRILDELLLPLPGIRPGQMFGHPGYYSGDKLCVFLEETGVCLKLPDEVSEEILDRPNASPFAPYGQPMRQWVLLTYADSEHARADLPLFQQAAEYVATTPKRTRKKAAK